MSRRRGPWARLLHAVRGSGPDGADPVDALTGRIGPGPLDCEQVGWVLQAHLDGEVEADLAGRVAEHLEACRRCGLDAETYEQIKAAVERSGGGLHAQTVARLRTFGERLVAGEVDGGAGPEAMPEG